MNLTVDEDGTLTFPPDLLEDLKWEIGDTLEFISNEDGSFTIKKVDELPIN